MYEPLLTTFYITTVDGGAWRTGKSGPGLDLKYSDFLLSGKRTLKVEEKRSTPSSR